MTKLFLDTNVSQFKDFEDAMQYHSAMQAGIEAVITRNGKDFTNSKLPVMTAGEYLAMISPIN
jgi:hypothetical protein